MNRLFTGLLFCALQSPCISQIDSIVFTVDWAQQFSNGNSAYFEEIVKSGDSLFVAGQWYQGSMANQLAMAIDAESGSVIWEHYRDCCGDHARYYEPLIKNNKLYFFGTQNGQGSSYFDVVFVEYDPQTGSEIEFTTWNYPGSNGFADVGVNNSGEFVILSNAASVQPLAIYEEHSQLFQTTIPNQPDFGRLTGLFHLDGAWFLYGAWEAHNLPGIIKLDGNLSIEWSQTIGESGNRRVFCGLHNENQFVLAGRDENLERGFVVVSDLEGNLESEIIFDPWLSSYSSVGSIAKYENGYFLTLRDFDSSGATTWLLALDESFEITGKMNLGEDFQFINGSISGRASAGNIVVSESSIFISGYENQNGFETPTLFKIEWAPALDIPGCTEPTACNFDAEATSDDGSCIPAGCTNEAACNFNPDAGCDDESCAFDEDLLDCDAFAFELDSLVVCFGEEFELTAPIANSPGALSGTAQFIDEFYLDFGGPSSHTLGDQPAGSYQITVSGTWCGGSCWNGHTTDAAYSFNHPYGNGIEPYNGSFTINEYCPSGDNSCELIRPEPDEYNPDHIYTYLFEHPGGEFIFHGLADCCYGDNQAGLNFSVSLLPTSPCALDYAWNNGANEASIVVGPQSSDFLSVTVSSSTEQCTDSLWIEVVNQGCSDAEACNFNPSDLCTVECIFPVLGAVDCDQGAETCGEGTIWNSETQTCVPEPVNPTASEISCGPGTYWDELESLCLPIETCEDDLDGDGVIGVNDLMQLLSSFGTDCTPDEEPETAEFTCGDPISYHGYDYATVLIGEQCWFAENLRAEQYQNGDEIPGNLNDDAWTNATEGAQAILHENEENVELHGRLYNFYAVLDERGLCPAGWHVPADEEWITLGEELGGIELAGAAMKNSESDTPPWNGTNSSHWNGTPGGKREMAGWYGGNVGYWWTSTPYGCGGWHRNLHPNLDALTLSSYCNVVGFSVRCLKD